MKRFLAIAGLMLTVTGGVATGADAQDYRYARPHRGDYRPDVRPDHYWRDGQGRTCYRRSDGVRRCGDDHGRRGYDRRYDRGHDRRYR